MFWLLFFIVIQDTRVLSQQFLKEAGPYDILINEIMADPTPVLGLPECEYLELYNRSAKTISLAGWKLRAGHNIITLPDTVLNPGDYGLIVDDNFSRNELFRGKRIAVNMPHITNTGQVITLFSKAGSVIHSVNFSTDWYNDKERDEGGWSVELMDASNPCGGRNNWRASEDRSGGTPGYENSVICSNPDNSPPLLLYASLGNDTILRLHFNEPLYYTSLDDISLYSADHGFYHPESAHPVEPHFTDVILYYHRHFDKGVVYHISLLDELRDCAGNHPVEALSAPFASTEAAFPSDLIFNEVLFETGNKVEFIELYNRSSRVIEISSLNLSLADESNVISKTLRISELNVPVFPGDYRVICRNGDELAEKYPGINPILIIENKELFALPDIGGLLVLTDTAGNVIDECFFSKALHYSLLSSTAGISIERLSAEISSDDRENWHSASASAGFATPGKPNSQNNDAVIETLALSSGIISPDGDGIGDEVTLYIQLNDPGWTGDVTIFSIKGQKMKTLMSNQLIGTHETVVWNGATDAGYMAGPGIYLVHVRLFSSRGEIKNFKKVISVVRK